MFGAEAADAADAPETVCRGDGGDGGVRTPCQADNAATEQANSAHDVDNRSRRRGAAITRHLFCGRSRRLSNTLENTLEISRKSLAEHAHSAHAREPGAWRQSASRTLSMRSTRSVQACRTDNDGTSNDARRCVRSRAGALSAHAVCHVTSGVRKGSQPLYGGCLRALFHAPGTHEAPRSDIPVLFFCTLTRSMRSERDAFAIINFPADGEIGVPATRS